MAWSMDGNRDMDVDDVCLWKGEKREGTCVRYNPHVLVRAGPAGDEKQKARACPCDRCSCSKRCLHQPQREDDLDPFEGKAKSEMLKQGEDPERKRF